MTQKQAQDLLDKIYNPNTPIEQKAQAYAQLSELFSLLLPKEK